MNSLYDIGAGQGGGIATTLDIKFNWVHRPGDINGEEQLKIHLDREVAILRADGQGMQ